MSKNKKYWKQLDRYFKTIEAELRFKEPDLITIDFYLWKIKRRVDILKKYVNDSHKKV